MVEVILTDEFLKWIEGLNGAQLKSVHHYLDLLEAKGVALGRPYSGTIAGSKHAMRELVIQAEGNPLRAFYVFDPKREAIVLTGGDKTGDENFYVRMIPIADRIYDQYLAEQAAGEPKEEEEKR